MIRKNIQARLEPNSAGRGVNKRLTWLEEARLCYGVVLGAELECHCVTNGSADICGIVYELTIGTDDDFVIDGLNGWSGSCNP